MIDDLPVDEVDEPIRALKVAEVRGGATPTVHPSGRFWRRDYPHLSTGVAVCHRRRHEAPDVDCTCGFHGVADLATLGETMRVFADSVVLEVDFGGLVVEHERGWRASEQTVIGARFHDRCAKCPSPASFVGAGRVWCPLCDTCAHRRRRRDALDLGEATARLGLDVAFASLPVESRRARWLGRLRSVGMLLLAIACLIAILTTSPPAWLLGGTIVAGAASFVATLAVWLARTSRNAGRLFVVQCWTVTAAAWLVVASAGR
jgi:hypothetical protein